MESMEDIFVAFGIPFSVCVLLPVAIVFIVARYQMNRDDKRTEVIIKALETNAGVNTDKLVEALNKSQLSPREIQNRRLLRGCIFSLLGIVCIIAAIVFAFKGRSTTEALLLGGGFIAVGVSYMIVYFVSRKGLTQDEDAA